jgi:CRP-like cAMP-binding protein
MYDVDSPIERVYFPETLVASVVAPMSDGSAVETATIGHEGFVGLPVFLGATQMTAQCFAQVPGAAYEMTVDAFQQLLSEGGEALTRVLQRYTQALLTLIAQASGCNRRHNVRQRCARWLLLTHDRVYSDVFPLTQRFLSQMLGVQRTTVTAAAKELENAECISYRHGIITIRDRAGLEREACECYAIIRAEFERLLDNRDVPSVFRNVRTTEGDELSAFHGGEPEGIERS